MKASIAGRVRNTNLTKGKALLPMFEAVMNAFQAGEETGSGNHRIDIIAERQGDLDDDKSGKIESFSITDTGIGFTDANYDSFQYRRFALQGIPRRQGTWPVSVAKSLWTCRDREPLPRGRCARPGETQLYI
jgi:hypothetical protein